MLSHRLTLNRHSVATALAVTLVFGLVVAPGGCTFDKSGMAPPGSGECGDGRVDPGEQCDDSNTVDGDGCSALCQNEASPDCGDGNLDPGEGCDDGNTTDCDGCSATCQNEACGNNALDCNEQCDDGNLTTGDGCDDACMIEIPPGCGNGQTDPGEQCDDGNTDPCDGCSPACLHEVCGNGNVDCGEQCDDSNANPCDGCSASCQNEVCGNNTVDCNEQCDDGNTTDCDGCSATCQLDGCGSGTLQCGEVCDSGNVTSDCIAEGFVSGNLTCASDCLGYDTSGCKRFDGQDCTSDMMCDSGNCLEENTSGLPGGMCTTDCFFTSCGSGTACRSYLGLHRCLQTCALSSDCRQGYYCRIDPDEYNELVCMALCESDSDCPDTGNCNVYSGRCQPDPSNNLKEAGSACWTDFECKGFCWDDPDGGYCSNECDMSSPACQGDAVCSPAFGASVGDLGLCLDGCVNNGDCGRSNYSCEPNPFAGADVCWPTP